MYYNQVLVKNCLRFWLVMDMILKQPQIGTKQLGRIVSYILRKNIFNYISFEVILGSKEWITKIGWNVM